MFKKLSLHLHKSQKLDLENEHNSQQFQWHEQNRESLIDPSSQFAAGQSRETYIEPNMSSYNVKPVSQMMSHDTHYHNNTTYYNNSDNSTPPNIKINNNDDDLPPLTMDTDYNPSPVSVGPPVTPISGKQDELDEMVQQGIRLHEQGQLEQATHMFRVAAEKGNPLGMFLFGVSMRHGWGCKKNEATAFQYLQKAAEHAVEDLNNIKDTLNKSASRNELIMAIYELGVSFRYGWGCKKNKESAVYFFKIAADLGDSQAQNDLAQCYLKGQGVKKDTYLAAKYYRKADKQGQGIMGNSWIWKPKYDHPKSSK